MAANVLVDAGFVIALLSRRDAHHRWAVSQAGHYPPPWKTCESALSEACYLLGASGAASLRSLLRRQAMVVAFDLDDHLNAVLKFMEKYEDVPASLADAALVRMTETIADPILLTTDADFGIYRRQGRLAVPRVTPS